MITIKPHSPLITGKDIVDFEKKYKSKIPSAYKKFLLQYNGGYPTPNCFKAEGYGESILGNFMGLKTKDEINNLEYCLRVFKNRVPNIFLIIARDQIGNLILIGLEGEYKNKIYFWWHEGESDSNKPIYTNIYPVSKNFDTFLNEIYDIEEDNSEGIEHLFKNGDNDKIKKMIESGWNVNSPLESGLRAIELVTMINNIEILKFLIAKGADVKNTLGHALTNDNLEAAKILLEAGADPNEIINENPLIYESIIFENIPFTKLILSFNPKINLKNDIDETPLDAAKFILNRGNKAMQEIIDLLISKGAAE